MKVHGKVERVRRFVTNICHSAGDAITADGVTVRAYIDHKQRWEDAEEITYDCYLLLITQACVAADQPSDKVSGEFGRVGMFVIPNRRKATQIEGW